MQPTKKGGKKQTLSPPDQTDRTAAPAAKQPTMETARAIGLLEERIAFISKEFSDNPTSMAYRDALKLAVAAMKREAGI